MKKLIKRLLQSDSLTLWLGAVMLVLVVVVTTILLSMRLADERKRMDPDVTIVAENGFSKTLRVVGDKDYKPFSYFNDNSEFRGYDIELVTELANRIECNLELQLMNWNEAVQMLQEKKADLILGCDWQDAAVMDCNFTVPTFEEKFVVFQEKPFKAFSDLYTKRIAVIEGCGLKDTLEKYQLWQNCVEYATVTDCVQAVLDKKNDCFIAHRMIGEVYLREFGEKGKDFRGRMDFASGQMCFGITKDDPELFTKINATLIDIRADGTMDALSKKWLYSFVVEHVSVLDYLREHPVILFVAINFTTTLFLLIVIMYFYLGRVRKEKNRVIAAEQAKSLFFSTVSHDIRTPLNAIIGYSELLKQDIVSEADRKNALYAITTSGNTLLELVNDILDLSKLETDKMVFNLEFTDMAKLASGVIHSFSIAINSRKVKLVEDIAPLPFLKIDPQRVRQILFNLIGNAVKFTEEGEVRITVKFDKNDNAEEGVGKLTFSVSDTGCGITPENQKKLMQPFVQVQESSSQKGTGLGLYICRQLANRMGGELTLKSEYGKGSTFTVVMSDVGFSENKPEDVEKNIKNPLPLLRRRVLVVDDVSVNRLVIKAILKRLDIDDVTLAINGVDALKALNKSPDGFDIVLTDIWMPVMDGKALVCEIRKNERWKELPVYAVTADTESHDSYGALGFTGVLLKPITMERLRKLLS